MENKTEGVKREESDLLDETALSEVNGGVSDGTTQMELELQMVVDPAAKRTVSLSNMQKKKSEAQDAIIKNMK